MDEESNPVEPGTSFPMTPPTPKATPKEFQSPQKSVRFKKTHRRNESKLSRISHLSIRSLKGGTIEEEDEADGNDEKELKPIYLFNSIGKFIFKNFDF